MMAAAILALRSGEWEPLTVTLALYAPSCHFSRIVLEMRRRVSAEMLIFFRAALYCERAERGMGGE